MTPNGVTDATNGNVTDTSIWEETTYSATCGRTTGDSQIFGEGVGSIGNEVAESEDVACRASKEGSEMDVTS